jgi:hypothetical protein
VPLVTSPVMVYLCWNAQIWQSYQSIIYFQLHLSKNFCSGDQMQFWEINCINTHKMFWTPQQNQKNGKQIWKRVKTAYNTIENYGGTDQLKATFHFVSCQLFTNTHTLPFLMLTELFQVSKQTSTISSWTNWLVTVEKHLSIHIWHYIL